MVRRHRSAWLWGPSNCQCLVVRRHDAARGYMALRTIKLPVSGGAQARCGTGLHGSEDHQIASVWWCAGTMRHGATWLWGPSNCQCLVVRRHDAARGYMALRTIKLPVSGSAQARCGTGLHGSDVLIASFVALAALAEETALEDTSRAAIHCRGLALILKNMTWRCWRDEDEMKSGRHDIRSLPKKWFPKNHEISKLVVWRSQKNPAKYKVKPLLFGECPMILRLFNIPYRHQLSYCQWLGCPSWPQHNM